MNDIHIQRFSSGKGKALDVCLMLHGFPAAVFSEPSFEKNHDIAQYIACNTALDVYLPHYRGLGRSTGSFSFMKSINDATDIAKRLLNSHKYRRIYLVGHSWGGLVAMNVLRKFSENVCKTVLLSPFTEISDHRNIEHLLEMICSDVDITFEAGSTKMAAQEFIQAFQSGAPYSIAHSCTAMDILVIQAEQDDEVPAQSTRHFIEQFKSRPRYIELDSDHRFMRNRNQVKQLIVDFFKQG